MTAAFKGGLTVKHGDGASPEVFTAIEEVINLSDFGKTNALIQATSHESAAHEYIAGLADGSELTIECNRVHTASNTQDDVIDDIDAGNTVNFQVLLTDGTVEKIYDFAAVCLDWKVLPSFDDKTTLNLVVKISGDITES